MKCDPSLDLDLEPGPKAVLFSSQQLNLELAGSPGSGPGLLHLVADLDKPGI